MAMLCAEWWSMDILILISTQLNTIVIGAMTISYNYLTIVYMVPYGF